jgi:hypothetical protein
MNSSEYRCMRNPTKVITKQNTRDSESREKAISTFRLPALIHCQIFTEYVLTSGRPLIKTIPRIKVNIAIRPIEPAPINPAAFLLSLCPKRTSMRKLRKGIAGIRAIMVLISMFFPLCYYDITVLLQTINLSSTLFNPQPPKGGLKSTAGSS